MRARPAVAPQQHWGPPYHATPAHSMAYTRGSGDTHSADLRLHHIPFTVTARART